MIKRRSFGSAFFVYSGIIFSMVILQAWEISIFSSLSFFSSRIAAVGGDVVGKVGKRKRERESPGASRFGKVIKIGQQLAAYRSFAKHLDVQLRALCHSEQHGVYKADMLITALFAGGYDFEVIDKPDGTSVFGYDGVGVGLRTGGKASAEDAALLEVVDYRLGAVKGCGDEVRGARDEYADAFVVVIKAHYDLSPAVCFFDRLEAGGKVIKQGFVNGS